MSLPVACWCKDRNHPGREACFDITEQPYCIVATRDRVRSIETGSVISGSKPPRGCCDFDSERAWVRGELIAKQIKIAASDTLSDLIQGIC